MQDVLRNIYNITELAGGIQLPNPAGYQAMWYDWFRLYTTYFVKYFQQGDRHEFVQKVHKLLRVKMRIPWKANAWNIFMTITNRDPCNCICSTYFILIACEAFGLFGPGSFVCAQLSAHVYVLDQESNLQFETTDDCFTVWEPVETAPLAIITDIPGLLKRFAINAATYFPEFSTRRVLLMSRYDPAYKVSWMTAFTTRAAVALYKHDMSWEEATDRHPIALLINWKIMTFDRWMSEEVRYDDVLFSSFASTDIWLRRAMLRAFLRLHMDGDSLRIELYRLNEWIQGRKHVQEYTTRSGEIHRFAFTSGMTLADIYREIVALETAQPMLDRDAAIREHKYVMYVGGEIDVPLDVPLQEPVTDPVTVVRFASAPEEKQLLQLDVFRRLLGEVLRIRTPLSTGPP